MNNYYSITPIKEKYICMVELRNHVGLLDEENVFINNMSIKLNVAMWTYLLGIYRIHNDTKLAKIIVEHI